MSFLANEILLLYSNGIKPPFLRKSCIALPRAKAGNKEHAFCTWTLSIDALRPTLRPCPTVSIAALPRDTNNAPAETQQWKPQQ